MTLEPPPWHADRPLTIEGARAAIAARFPDLVPVRIESLGSGWDNDAYLVGAEWVFRFPRRRAVVARLERQQAVGEPIAAALGALGVRTPVIERMGDPGPDFPYPFGGHRFVHGVAADTLPPGVLDRSAVARALGRALARLHALSAAAIAPALVPSATSGPREWMDALNADATELTELLPPDLLAVSAPYLEGRVVPPDAYGGPPRLIHDDLGPEHVLADPETGVLTGLIDFEDIAWGDPVSDVVACACWLGYDFVDELFAHYDLPLDDGFRQRLVFLARTFSLTWLADVYRQGTHHQVAKHEAWIRCAFGLARPDGTDGRARGGRT